jgi:hypothetical protein
MTRTFTFGPGALEMLELRVWTARSRYGRRHADEPRRIKAELTGWFDVDNGETGPERVAIREAIQGWDPSVIREERLVVAARNGDAEAAEQLAGELLEWALEDWVRAA